jgi:hypothetical protein
LERLKTLPASVCPDNIGSYDVVIPKLHVYSHNLPCPTDFSLNYLPGAGQGIERVHSMTGPVCASTKQMGLGYRHDQLDAQWLFWNWQQVVGMGKHAPSIKIGIGFSFIFQARLYTRSSSKPFWKLRRLRTSSSDSRSYSWIVFRNGRRWSLFERVITPSQIHMSIRSQVSLRLLPSLIRIVCSDHFWQLSPRPMSSSH